MKLPWFRERNKIEVVPLDGIEFLSDQDGIQECALKTKVCEVLDNSPVSEAYLARVRYPHDAQDSVTLCLKGGAAETNEVVQRVFAKFVPMFSHKTKLDILFLNEEQAKRIQSVCTPFFRRRPVQ